MVSMGGPAADPASETAQFGVDGRRYEADLTKDNAQQLRAVLKHYVRAARPAVSPRPAQEAARIRVWARQNGYEAFACDRIHHEVIEAYRQTV